MSEFNSKRYYGYSMGNENGLTSTTRNFEFQHTRAEYLDRALQKMQKPELQKKKMFLMEKFSRLRTPDDIHNQVRDLDVDTSCGNTRIRSLSANEVDNLIEKVRSSIVVIPKESDKQRMTPAMQSSNNVPRAEEAKCNMAVKCKHRLNQEKNEANKKLTHVAYSEYRSPKPKWVEIEEAVKGTAHYTELVHTESLQSTIDISDTEMDIPTQEHPSNDISPGCLSPQSNSMESMIDNTTLNMADCCVYNVDCNADEDVNEEIEIIDSDLEYELMQRPDYTKFCSPRPPPEDLDNQPNENMIPPQFVRIEPDIPAMGLSFLKNTAPMRYTELTDDTQADECEEQPLMKVFIKHRNENEEKLLISVDNDKQLEQNISEDTSERKKFEQAEKTPRSKITPRSKHTKYSTNATKNNAAQKNIPRLQTKTAQATPRAHGVNKQPRDAPKEQKIKANKLKRLKKIILTRSIEELKAEKAHIFIKMTNTQERIIEILDKLKLNLVEIYAPTGIEKHKRQKNAFEFSVRFSRNFLLPLKGMIQDLRTVTPEQLNSAVTNEATSRIFSIYSLLYQALQAYSKQIRYFLMDSLPQKLLTLIDYIHTVTNICLDKSIFDPNDAIIDCLKDRCTKFASFICDLHAERFAQKHKNVKANHANYDLKMFMNDLNMYEPILIPKNVKYRPRRQMNQRKLVATQSTANLKKKVDDDPIPVPPAGPSSTEDTSVLVQGRYVDKAVRTEIEDIHDSNSSVNLVHTLESFLSIPEKNSMDKQELSKVIMDALQTVTKDQVRQALDSILDSLGSALETKRNCDTIETIVNALNVKLDENELENSLKEDEISKNIEPTSAKVSAKSTSKSLKVRKHTKARLHQQQPQENSPYENRYDDNQLYDFDTALTVQENTEKFDTDEVNSVDTKLRDSVSFLTEDSEIAEEKLYDSDGSLSTHVFVQQEECSNFGLSDTEPQLNLEKNKYNRKSKKQMFSQIRRKLSELKLEKQQLQRELHERDQELEEYRKQAEQFKREQVLAANTYKMQQPQVQVPEKYVPKFDKSRWQLNQKKVRSPASSLTHIENSKSGSSYTTNIVKPVKAKTSMTARPSPPSKPPVKRQAKLKMKKKRNIFLPPPPAPTVTPCTSARSNSDQMSLSENVAVNAIKYRNSPRQNSSDVILIENMPIRYDVTKKCVSNNDIDQALEKKLANRHKYQNVSVTKSGPIRVPFTHSFGFSQANPPKNILERFSQVKNGKYDLRNADSSTIIPCRIDAVPVQSFMDLHNNSRDSPMLSPSQNSLIREEEAVEKLYIKHKQQLLLDDPGFRNHSYKDLYNLEKVMQNKYEQNIPEYNAMYREDAAEQTELVPKLPDKKSAKNKISNIEAFTKERDAFLNLCSTNRFYKNPNFNEPWKVFTQLSEKLANEIVDTVEVDFSTGVTKFVEDFLQMETQI